MAFKIMVRDAVKQATPRHSLPVFPFVEDSVEVFRGDCHSNTFFKCLKLGAAGEDGDTRGLGDGDANDAELANQITDLRVEEQRLVGGAVGAGPVAGEEIRAAQ